MHQIQPDEVYNLGAMSHVKVSFEMPEYTASTDAVGTIRLLEAIRAAQLDCKFYQASTSEMFGATPPPQNEQTVFYPRSPVRRGQALLALGHRQLPRGLRHVRGVAASCSTTSPPVAARRS